MTECSIFRASLINIIMVYYVSEICEKHGLSFINYGSLTSDNKKKNGMNRILFIGKPQIVYLSFSVF